MRRGVRPNPKKDTDARRKRPAAPLPALIEVTVVRHYAAMDGRDRLKPKNVAVVPGEQPKDFLERHGMFSRLYPASGDLEIGSKQDGKAVWKIPSVDLALNRTPEKTVGLIKTYLGMK